MATVRGREKDVIQPEGQTWRALRNSDISVLGGWAFARLLAIIATFSRQGTLGRSAATAAAGS